MNVDIDAVNLALLLLRAMVGVTMLAHGYNHIWGGGKIEGTGRWFASLGMKPGIVHAWLASVTELVCGAMLIVGLGMPFAAAGVVGVMVVAFLINHRPNGFFIFRPGEGYEYVLNLAVAGVALGVLGAGGWGLDHALGIFTPGWVNLVIVVGAGVGGALGLLLVFWRPEPAADGS